MPVSRQTSARPANVSPMPAPQGFTTLCNKVQVQCLNPPLQPQHWSAWTSTIFGTDACARPNCSNSGYLQLTDAQFYALTTTGVRSIIYGNRWSGGLPVDNIHYVFTSAAPVNLPAKWTRVLPQLDPYPWPEPVADPVVQPRVRPRLNPRLRPYERGVTELIVSRGPRGEPVVRVNPKPRPHRLVPTKEKKAEWQKALGRLISAYHAATEIKDFFKSLADALPDKKCSSKPGFAMAMCVLSRYDEIDPVKAAYNLHKNAIEDAILGRVHKRLSDLRANGGPLAIQVTGLLRHAKLQ